MVRYGNPLVVEILADFAEHVVITLFLEIGGDHGLAVGVGIGASEAQFLGSPCPQHPVAPCHGPEPHFLVKGELPLKTFLALVECRHTGLPWVSIEPNNNCG